MSTSLREILPQPNDRAFFAGTTGSGKTTLAERMLRYYPYVVVYDAKGLIRWPGYERHESLVSLSGARQSHLIYAPSWEEFRDRSSRESFFEWVYRRGHCILYVDEAMLIARREEMPEFYYAAYIRGRELGLGVWSSSQRPMGLEQVILSESEHFYVFHLSLGQDRAKFEGIMEEYLPSLPAGHEFFYIRKGSAHPPRRLVLTGIE